MPSSKVSTLSTLPWAIRSSYSLGRKFPDLICLTNAFTVSVDVSLTCFFINADLAISFKASFSYCSITFSMLSFIIFSLFLSSKSAHLILFVLMVSKKSLIAEWYKLPMSNAASSNFFRSPNFKPLFKNWEYAQAAKRSNLVIPIFSLFPYNCLATFSSKIGFFAE